MLEGKKEIPLGTTGYCRRGVALCVCARECVYRQGCGSKGPSWVNSVGCEWVAGRSINVLRRESFTSSRTLSFEISFKKKKKQIKNNTKATLSGLHPLRTFPLLVCISEGQ